MEAWVLIAWVYGNPYRRPIKANPQSEDACILAAKAFPAAVCISEFEGRVLFFRNGKMVEKL